MGPRNWCSGKGARRGQSTEEIELFSWHARPVLVKLPVMTICSWTVAVLFGLSCLLSLVVMVASKWTVWVG